jgi:hypothetical protein
MLSTPHAPAQGLAARRWKWLALSVLVILILLPLVLAGLAYYAVPWALTQKVPQWLKEKTGHVLIVEQARFHPFKLTLDLGPSTLHDPQGKPLIAMQALSTRAAWRSLIRTAIQLTHLHVTGPEVSLVQAADGTLNWARFVSALPKVEPKTDGPPKVLIQDIVLSEGRVAYTDASVTPAYSIALGPAKLTRPQLSTLPEDRSSYSLEAKLTGGAAVLWEGSFTTSPMTSEGRIALTDLALPPLAAHQAVPVRVLAGSGTATADYTFAVKGDSLHWTVRRAALAFQGLSLAAANNAPAMKLGGMTVAGIAAASGATHINASDIAVAGFTVLQPDARTPAITIDAANIRGLLWDTARKSLVGETLRIAGIDYASASAKPAPTAAGLRLGSIEAATLEVDAAAHVLRVPTAQFADFSFGDAAAGTGVSLKRGEAEGFVLNLATNGLSAKSLALDAGALSLRREASGAMRSVPALAPFATVHVQAAAPAVAIAQQNAPAFSLDIPNVTLAPSTVLWQDEAIAEPQRLSTSLGLQATIKGAPAEDLSISIKQATLGKTALRSVAGNTAPWLTVEGGTVSTARYDTRKQQFSIDALTVNAPSLTLVGTPTGPDIAARFAARTTPAVPAAQSGGAPAKASPPPLVIKKVVLNQGSLTYRDEREVGLPAWTVNALTATLTDVVPTRDAAMGFDAKGVLASGGAVRAQGGWNVLKSTGEIAVNAEAFALVSLNPYLRTALDATIARGTGAAQVQLSIAPDAFKAQGSATLTDIQMVQPTALTPIFAFGGVSTNRFSYAQQGSAQSISVDDVLIERPQGAVTVNADRSLNLAAVLKPTAPAAAGDATPMKTDVRISRIQLTGGDVEFADRSITPAFATRITDLSGLVVGVSSAVGSRTEIGLEGKVDDFGLARLSGALETAAPTRFMDLKASFRNLEFTRMSPYTVKFAGRRIASGKLTLDLGYKINERKLAGDNKIIMDQLTLGERVESPGATNLPLDFAVAILKDKNGRIDLGLPISGDLNDPQFDTGDVVWKAVVSVLTKIVTAPFTALASLFGGNAEDVAQIAFEAGEARLLPPEREKLSKLAKALSDRPALALTIAGTFDTQKDRAALADNIVKSEIAKRAGLRPPGANEPLLIPYTDEKVHAALDALAATTLKADAVSALRKQYWPQPEGLLARATAAAALQLSREAQLADAAARQRYYEALVIPIREATQVPEFAYALLASTRADAVRNSLVAVNKEIEDRVNVSAAEPAKAAAGNEVFTRMALKPK